MSPATSVRLERHGKVAVITLNRPEAHNAIDPEMACGLVTAFEEFQDNPDLLAAVITGAGDKAFCSGGDLGKTLPLLSGARAPETIWDERCLADPDILTRAALRMPGIDKPIIAAVNGFCLAAGMEMLLATDIRIAAEHAIFGLPEARHGLIPFAGALARIARQASYCEAMEILLVGGTLPAAEARRMGLVNHVLSAAEVMPKAMALAERIAANGPLAVREIKRTVNACFGSTMEQGFRLEDLARERIMASDDAREGPAAFMAKRAPQFTGR